MGSTSKRARSSSLMAASLLVLTTTMLLGAEAAHAASVVSLAGTSRTFSPNGDRRSDLMVVKARLTTSAKLTLAVYDPSGRKVKTLASGRLLRRGTRRYTWNGRFRGAVPGNGYYTVRATAKVGRRSYKATARSYLDIVAPLVKSYSEIAPTLFAGGGKTARVPYRVTDASRTFKLSLAVYDSRLKVVSRRALRSGRATGSVTWDGRKSARGAYVPPGPYKVRVTAEDWAGNRGTGDYFNLSVFAPTTVKGTVVDLAGKAVSGATVAVAGTKTKATTGVGGAFTLTACPLGYRTLVVTKPGQPKTTVVVNVNYRTARVAVRMGRSSTTRTARRRAAGADDVTLSGRFTYQGKDGIGYYPIRYAKIKLLDHVSTWFTSWDREIATGSTDENGNFSITYDSTSWDEGGRYDVKAGVCSVDRNGELAEIRKGLAYDPYRMDTGRYDDLGSNVSNLYYVDTGSYRACWSILDQVRGAHDYMMLKTGSHRGFITVFWPQDCGDANGNYNHHFDWINIDEEASQSIVTPRHEYFHALQKIAYNVYQYGWVWNNAYHAYQGTHDSFYYEGKWYTSQGDSAYGGFEDQSTGWNALREGWAEFGAAASIGDDRGFEADFSWPDKDDNRVPNSVSRVLWDLVDDDSSLLLYRWEIGTVSPLRTGPRLITPCGLGDDDPLVGGFPANRRGDMIEKVWDTLQRKMPATASELRQGMRSVYNETQLDYRALDAVFYKLGIGSGVTENVPVVHEVTATASRRPDGSLRGDVTLWARVSDADTLSDADGPAGSTWDTNHLRVRFDVSGQTTAGAAAFPRTHLSLAVERSAAAPPGASGTGWFKGVWSTTTSSTVQLHPSETEAGYLAYSDVVRGQCALKSKAARVTAYAVAFDQLAEGQSTSTAFTVDNTLDPGGGAFQKYGRPTMDVSYIRYDSWGHSQPDQTYELRFKPFVNGFGWVSAGVIAMTSFEYHNYLGDQLIRMPIMKIELLSDARVRYSVNEYDGGGPGDGTWHTVTSATTLTADWHHLAVQHGTGGMQLYIDGHLVGSDPTTVCPQPDYSNSTLADGAFSLSAVHPIWGGFTAAGGAYDELRVSNRRRYAGDFTPLAVTFGEDTDTVILDHLDGTTVGTNSGFAFEP